MKEKHPAPKVAAADRPAKNPSPESQVPAASGRPKFYLTTPIFYVSAGPHVGHAYTTLACDAVARYHRMLGHDTWFITGTDEHGQKIERAAAQSGITPKQFTNRIAEEYAALWQKLGIAYDDFIRTTEPRHQRGVQWMFQTLQKKGHIYKGKYTGQYCVFDELYVDNATPGSPCPECGRPTETVSEENYFFKLSAFQEKLLRFYNEHPGFIRPESRRNEVIAFVRSGLRDLSVSRTSVKWGIPVPGDAAHVIYVWLDALCNYATAVGLGSPDKADQEKFARYWPADVHMVGKEIVRFHCVYWPAFLMAAELPLPKSVIVHGWLLFEQDKMSKSRGNIVRAQSVSDVLGADALRYFLLREIPFGQDGAFSFDALVTRYNADLANDLGNLASRTLTMISKYFRNEVPYPSKTAARAPADEAIARQAAETIAEYNRLFAEYQFSRALETVWSLVGSVNKYLVENQPWAVTYVQGEPASEQFLFKGDTQEDQDANRARVATTLYTSAEALRIVTALAHPVLPQATAKIWKQLGLGDIAQADPAQLQWGQLPLGTKLGAVEPVFPRAEKSAISKMQELEQSASPTPASSEKSAAEKTSAHPAKPPKAQAGVPVRPLRANSAEPANAGRAGVETATQAVPSGAAAPPTNEAAVGARLTEAAASPAAAGGNTRITIDDFAKVELRVGEVKAAEKVKGADKLLRLDVDIGSEVRQVVAGIAKAYAPEKLIGRKVVIVVNLAPRKLRGLESNGMIVAASVGDDGQPVLAGFLEDVPIGARLK